MPIDYYSVCVTCERRGPAIWRPDDPAKVRAFLQLHGSCDVRIVDEGHEYVEAFPPLVIRVH